MASRISHGIAVSNIVKGNINPFGKIAYGPGGRSSNSGMTATVFGNTGFLGRYLMYNLGARGTRCYAPYRGDELEGRHLKILFDVGQLGQQPFSPRDDDSIRETMTKSDVAVNMMGKYYETKHIVPTRRADGSLSRVNYSYDEVNVQMAGNVARLAKEAGVKSFIHVSALSADINSKSEWSRTKALGEIEVRKCFPEAIIVRPATLFGVEDRFLNWMGEMVSKLQVYPLVNGGESLIQPVHAVDVGKALMTIIQNAPELAGSTFQLAGPSEYTYREIVEYVSDVTMHYPTMMDVPAPIANIAGTLIDKLKNPVLTPDMVVRMQEDCVLDTTDPTLKTFADLGMTPTNMDKASFDYLLRFRTGGHFEEVTGYH